MRTFKLKLAGHLFITLLITIGVSASLFFSSCKTGNDSVTGPVHDCGNVHNIFYGPYQTGNYSSTFVDTLGNRIFEYSILVLAGLADSLCTKSDVIWHTTGTWHESISNAPRLVSIMNISASNSVFELGSYVDEGTDTDWTGDQTFDLSTVYGDGPGRIIDAKVQASFPSLGSISADRQYLENASFIVSMQLTYAEFKPQE